MDANEAIDIFHRKIMLCEGATTRNVAWHEAGHRFIFGTLCPEIKTKYAIINGLPCATPVKPRTYIIDEMTEEDAAKLAHIKLGGVAAEMMLLCINTYAKEICDWLADDYLGRRWIDWDDDERAGGDLSQAIQIIIAKSNEISMCDNLYYFMLDCLRVFMLDWEMFDNECRNAFRIFCDWRNKGKWSI